MTTGMRSPTLDYLTEARRRGAIQRSRVDGCRCEVCTARAAAVRGPLTPAPDREGLTNA
jgi:hypothetical protein